MFLLGLIQFTNRFSLLHCEIIRKMIDFLPFAAVSRERRSHGLLGIRVTSLMLFFVKCYLFLLFI